MFKFYLFDALTVFLRCKRRHFCELASHPDLIWQMYQLNMNCLPMGGWYLWEYNSKISPIFRPTQCDEEWILWWVNIHVLLLLIKTQNFWNNQPTTFICVCNVSATSNHSFGSALPSSSWLLRAAVQWRMRHSFVQNCTYCCLHNLPCIPVVFVDNIHHQTSWKNGDKNS